MNLNINEEINKKLYNYLRIKTLKNITNNLGDVFETYDKFICFVSQKKLDLFYCNNKYKTLNLRGFNINDSENVKLKLNKPVYYVFEGLVFHNKLKFNAIFNPYIIFKNCEFKKNIYTFFSNATIKFQNNKYLSNWVDMYFDDYYFDINNTDNIIFQNDNIVNINENNQTGKFGLKINANNVTFKYTNIKIPEPSEMFIKAGNLKMDYSNINVSKMIIDADNIHNSSYIHSKNLIIDNKNNNVLNYIHADNILYNNLILKDEFEDSNLEDTNTIDKDLIIKQELKLNVLDILKKLKNKCEMIKQEELKKKEEELNSSNLSKILKK